MRKNRELLPDDDLIKRVDAAYRSRLNNSGLAISRQSASNFDFEDTLPGDTEIILEDVRLDSGSRPSAIVYSSSMGTLSWGMK
ncbi:MAG: hypothetical protein K2H64_00635 [Desulfovibrio sp.]|nr:hypothetical protein [Desulfovibrio sp.]